MEGEAPQPAMSTDKTTPMASLVWTRLMGCHPFFRESVLQDGDPNNQPMSEEIGRLSLAGASLPAHPAGAVNRTP